MPLNDLSSFTVVTNLLSEEERADIVHILCLYFDVDVV